jgi:predicted nucleic acid-binding Zn ribbon protein
MPIYDYEYLDKNDEPTGERFEWFQTMAEDALTKHPENGKPCRRAVSAPAIAGKWSDMKTKSALSNENLDRLGFTKYEKRGDGYMERTAGDMGPRELSADD